MTLEEMYRLLRGSHVQAQGIVDTLKQPLVVLDRGLTVINANPAFYRKFETDREETLGHSLLELGNGQWDVPALRSLLGEVVPKATAIVGYEVSHEFPNLGQRTMRVSARTLAHPDGNSTQMLVLFDDVTDYLQADAAKDILLAETRHRMKNLMAIIRATARNTEVKEKTGQQYRDDLLGRLETILAAQTIVTDETEIDFQSLIYRVVKPVAGDRGEIVAGPNVSLADYQITPLSMILHELATNALKYGALSNSTGRVHIDWSTEQREGQNHLMVNWREEGGPAVTPPDSLGFGTKLIDYSARAEGGEASLHFDRGGLRAQIDLPI